jgi:DNA replication protein DnaC
MKKRKIGGNGELDFDDIWVWEKDKCFMSKNCSRKSKNQCSEQCGLFYRIMYVYSMNNIPSKFRDLMVQDLDKILEDTQTKCIEHVRRLVDEESYDRGMLITGRFQVGKTTLASCMLNEYFRRTILRYSSWDLAESNYTPILFVPFATYADLKRDRFKDNPIVAKIDQNIFRSELIVLDDITAGNYTQHSNELLFNIVDSVVSEGRSLIITDNHTPKELSNIVGDRIYARIKRVCEIIDMEDGL